MLVYEDIDRMKDVFESFNVCHVRRAGNTLAHLITRWDIEGEEFVWLNNFAQSLTTLAELDLI